MDDLLDWVGRVVGDRYRLLRLIGEGGMGVVYEARHEILLRTVAVKFLWPAYTKDPSAVRRFQREAQAAGRIGHDNICEVLDLGQTGDGIPYMVMPLLRGRNLGEEITDCGVVPLGRAVDIMSQTLDALAAAHEHAIIHRDIKPDNIFLTSIAGRDDLVKILDFGVAKVLHGTASVSAPHLTKTGAVVGTASYMSPEQARGVPEIDHRVDIYAAGAVLYEMLTGVRMYDGATYNEVIHKIFSGDVKTPSEVRPDFPLPLERVISRAVARLPERRFSDASAFRAALVESAAQVRSSGASATASATQGVEGHHAPRNDGAPVGRAEPHATATASRRAPAASTESPALASAAPPVAQGAPLAVGGRQVMKEEASAAWEEAPARARAAALPSTLPIGRAAAEHAAAGKREQAAPSPDASGVILPVGGPREPAPDSAASPGADGLLRPPSTTTAGATTTLQNVRPWKSPWRMGLIAATTFAFAAMAIYFAIDPLGGQPRRTGHDAAGARARSPAAAKADIQPATGSPAADAVFPPAAQAPSETPTLPPATPPVRPPDPASASAVGPSAARASHDARTSSAPATPEPVGRDDVPTVHLAFPALPAGATVTIGGLPATLADGHAQVVRSSDPVDIVIMAPGYREWHGVVRPSRDRRVPVSLGQEHGSVSRLRAEGSGPDAGIPAPPTMGFAAASPHASVSTGAGATGATRPVGGDAGTARPPADMGAEASIHRGYTDAGSRTSDARALTAEAAGTPAGPGASDTDATRDGGIHRSYDLP